MYISIPYSQFAYGFGFSFPSPEIPAAINERHAVRAETDLPSSSFPATTGVDCPDRFFSCSFFPGPALDDIAIF